jgi:hypothetical protein
MNEEVYVLLISQGEKKKKKKKDILSVGYTRLNGRFSR